MKKSSNRTFVETLKRTIASTLNKKGHGYDVVETAVGSGVTRQTLKIGEHLDYERLLIVRGEQKDSVNPVVLWKGNALNDEILTDEIEHEVRECLRSHDRAKDLEPSKSDPDEAAMEEFMADEGVKLADVVERADKLGVTVTINGRTERPRAKKKRAA